MKNCIHFGRCGGCTVLNSPYADQILKKQERLKELFMKERVVIPPIHQSPVIYYYRQKVQLPFGFKGTFRNGSPQLGCYATDSHEIVNQQMCHIQNRDCTSIVQSVRNWVIKTGLSTYNEHTAHGFLRYVLIRRATGTGEILIGLITNGAKITGTRVLSRMLLELIEKKKLKESTVVGIVQNVNTRKTNVVLGDVEYIWWGRPYIKEQLGSFHYKIGLSTFFQVNPYQTPALYNEVLRHISSKDKVLDCYCGVGSIALWVAHRCRRVTGIEENKSAVRAARTAAKINKISNVSFVVGDVLSRFQKLSLKGYGCVIVDPPRKGIPSELIEGFCRSDIRKIIYVSCNPESLLRDIRLFKKEFQCMSVQGVDMFPHTDHIETVSKLERR